MTRAHNIAMASGIALLTAIAILITLLLSFDWNRAKPWISTRIAEATGRSFAIRGDLSLTWHAPQGETGWRAWVPWPRLNAHDVVFGNAGWAEKEIMAEARQVTFSISPLPLINKRITIPSLALDAPQLILERLADGRNNWHFHSDKKPEARWQLDVRRLILSKGTVQVIDAVRHAKLKADIDTLGDGDDHYRIGWRISGSVNGEPMTGTGRAGGIVSLQKRGTDYPIDASLRVGKTVIDAEGTLTDPSRLAALDLKLKVSGVSMAHLYPLTGVLLPDTKPFVTEGRLRGKAGPNGGDWSYEKFTGKVGSSDVAGTLHYRGRETRPQLEGTVGSDYLNFNDLSPLIGADSVASRNARGVKTVQPADKVFPVEIFKVERWNSIDADVQFTARKLVRKETLPIDNVVTRIHLEDGVLSLAPLKFGVAGGNLVSTIKLDGRTKPVKGELRLSARHMKLKQLFPASAQMQSSVGEINGDAVLTASGNSIAALLASSNGEVRAVLNQGTVSKLFLESLGLNIGSIITTQLFGDKQVDLNCGVSDFIVTKGVLKTRAFVIDTSDATIHVSGDISLAQEQLALTVLPEGKGLRLISLRAPLYVSGSFKKPKVEADRGVMAAKAGGAIALAALAPVAAALLPLINVGPGEKSACGTLLALATDKPVAPRADKQVSSTSGK